MSVNMFKPPTPSSNAKPIKPKVDLRKLPDVPLQDIIHSLRLESNEVNIDQIKHLPNFVCKRFEDAIYIGQISLQTGYREGQGIMKYT